MSQFTLHLPKPCLQLLAAAALCSVGTTEAVSGNLEATGDGMYAALAKELRVSKPATLNLLAGRKGAADRRITSLQIGRGSYLCTPAGFGQKSRCRRN